MSSEAMQPDVPLPSLMTLPPEATAGIFCQLPSFFDILCLSRVCCRLRQVWLDNVTLIYREVAPRSIPCETAARRFLVDQSGRDPETPLSAEDVVRMLHNAAVVEKAILQFESEIVSRVKGEHIT